MSNASNGKNVGQIEPATASLESLASLAELLRSGKVGVNASLITILDASGKVVKVEDLPLAFLALAYDGRAEGIRELERALGLRLPAQQAQAHELAAVAAASGYERLLEQYPKMVKLDPRVATGRLASDLKAINGVTGIAVPQELDEMVFSAIAALDFVSDIVPSVRMYVRGTGAVPSAAVAQKLYSAVITPDRVMSYRRVEALGNLLNIKPTLGRGVKARTIDDYVRNAMKATGQELSHKHPLHKQLEEARNPERFIQGMSLQFGLLSGSDGYNQQNIAGALNYLSVAALKDIALPEDVSVNLPRHLVMALVHESSEDNTLDRVRRVLAALERRGAYAVDTGAFQAAITEGLKLLAEKSSGATGHRLSSIRKKGRFLTGLSHYVNLKFSNQASTVGLTGQDYSYLRQVDPGRYGTLTGTLARTTP